MINQKELISRVRSQLFYQYSITDIELILKAATEFIVESTANGEEVSIMGLGKFYGKFFKGKEIHNPGIEWLKHGTYKVPNRFRLKFQPTKLVNKRVNKLTERIEKIEKNLKNKKVINE